MVWNKKSEQLGVSENKISQLFKDWRGYLQVPGIILLQGPLGAGKTALVRQFAKQLGCEEAASPSFAIHHQYLSPKGTIQHFDLYRLENEDELESSGFWDVITDSKSWIVIEWPERLSLEQLPLNRKVLKIEIVNRESTRDYRLFEKAET